MKNNSMEPSISLIIRDCILWGLNNIIDIISQSTDGRTSNKDDIMEFKRKEYLVRSVCLILRRFITVVYWLSINASTF
jgi:hypothetical protein